ncbi:MAG: sigma-70 family RNA polymerase sigma factor [Candidatus Dormibacteraeota bacterium]|nr:sigma-70 family RNA polymerase sigma factor [Candidatus Dormibacteraeota bacterium]
MTEAVRAGDKEDFSRLFERHQGELRLHCYRMLGSLADAEDLVQDTFLRAWRYRHSFSARSTFRAWLYRIATNACLDFLRDRPRRVLPYDVAPPADPEGSMPAPLERPWLEPCPDRWLDAAAPGEEGPEAVVVAKETVELAFLAAIQHLPPRQRAVLILRDVLEFPAAETAELLEMSVASVKSALQRARATLRGRLPAPASKPDASEEEEAVLRRYMAAHERGDPRALAAVLSQEVRVSFPPLPLWAEGRDTFIAASRKHAAVGEYRFVPTRANGQPAVAIYLRAPGEPAFRPLTLEVLRVEGGQVAEIIDFTFPTLFSAFGLPPSL